MVEGQGGESERTGAASAGPPGSIVPELEALLGSMAGLVEATLREAQPGSTIHEALTRIGASAARARELLRAPPAARPLESSGLGRGAPVPRGAERVLLVEDEPMVRSAHRRLLASLGYQVTAAADGEEALQVIRGEGAQFDLVLTDQTMPHLSGIGLALVLAKERPSLPVLLCSGFSDSPEEAAAKEAGVAACLQKPIDRASLASVLRLVLDARKGA